MTLGLVDSQQVDLIVQSLRARLPDFDDATIAAAVSAELGSYGEARITQFVPILVESRVRVRLNGASSVSSAMGATS